MEINEEEKYANNDESSKEKLSLRKAKKQQETQFNPINLNSQPSLLPAELIYDGDKISLNKKRLREENSNQIENFELIENISTIEQNIYEKIKNTWEELLPKPSKGLKEDDYDYEDHNRREKIVNDLVKNNNDLILEMKNFALKTDNENIFCMVLENFNTFCYYNNTFIVESADFLDKLILKAFEFKKNEKTIALTLKLSYCIFDFKFVTQEQNELYANLFIDIALNEEKLNIINNISNAKTYLFYLIYLIFEDSLNYIKIKEENFYKFIELSLKEINTNDIALLEIIIRLLNVICEFLIYTPLISNENSTLKMSASLGNKINNNMFLLIKNIMNDQKENIINNSNMFQILKKSFSVIAKIISIENFTDEKNKQSQEILVTDENKKFVFEFIKYFSNLPLNKENFCWFLDILAKFSESSYFCNIFLNYDIINIIFKKLSLKKENFEDFLQFMRSLLETDELFKFYSLSNEFYEVLKEVDINSDSNYCLFHFLFIIQNLIVKPTNKKININDIFDKLCGVQAKEKVEQIYYKYSSNDKKMNDMCRSILHTFEELQKKIICE